MLIVFSDEILYQAKLHPEQYSNTFSNAQVKQLHDAMMYVCNTAVETLAESDKFPEDWLMKHRWGKGKKDKNMLPNGAKITFLKVGGRTSAVVPSVQKKSGAVAGDVSESTDGVDESDEDAKPKKGNKRKSKKTKDEDEDEDEEEQTENEAEEEQEDKPAPKKQKKSANGTLNKAKASKIKTEDTSGKRRSGRNSKG